MKGRIHSIQTLGATDGPGIRFTVFVSGCPLRCVCCHNPDTWEFGGVEMTVEELCGKAERYREYFKDKGGITVSGGEPLCQAEFVAELFKLAKEKGINTCLDTSGCVLNDEVKALLEVTDIVMLDIKYTTNEDYQRFVGCELSAVIEFLKFLQEINKRTIIRQVVIPGLNDSEENIERLKTLLSQFSVVEKVELLPFKKLCVTKYDGLGIDFPLKDTPEASKELVARLQSIID